MSDRLDARRWALDTLRDVSDRLERAPRHRLVEALPRLAGTIETLGREAALVCCRAGAGGPR